MFGIFQSTTIPALEQSLTFSQRRHELLAGNIANLDTPGYRQKDLDLNQFQAALADSIQAATEPSLQLHPTTRDDQYAGPRAASEQIVFHDGSDVSLERQVTEISKNKHLHGLAVTTMRSQFALLRAAITERA
jgi:flagellar basal-body rod protein FlgB